MRYKHILPFLFLLLLLLSLLTPYALANSAEPFPAITVRLSNLPENAVYADLLIPINESDEHFSALESKNIPDSFAENADILHYCDKEAYRSYTFHFRDAKSNIRISPAAPHNVVFGADAADRIASNHDLEILRRGTVKLAVLDAQGNILHVSDALRTSVDSIFLVETRSYSYSVSDGEWVIDAKQPLLYKVFQWLIQVPILIFLNAILEAIVALFFRLREYIGTIFLTNLVSRFLMRVLYVLLRSVIPSYWLLMLLLEALVYISECLVYRQRMKTVSRKKCLVYTLTANTVTLLLSVLLQIFFFPMP